VTTTDISLVRGNTADVIRILSDQIAIEVVQRLAHLTGMFLIDAEHDRFGKAVALFEKLREMAGDGLGTGAQRHCLFEILSLVFIVGYRTSVPIELVPARSPASGVPFSDDTMHPVGGKEAIIDPLPKLYSKIGFPKYLYVSRLSARSGVAVMPS
jgi:hypothetical protein